MRKGIDLFFRDKRPSGIFDYWLSYSYMIPNGEFLNYPVALQPSFVANHHLALVTKKFITEWKTGFNLTYSWASAGLTTISVRMRATSLSSPTRGKTRLQQPEF